MADKPPPYNGQFDKAMGRIALAAVLFAFGASLGASVSRHTATIVIISLFAIPFIGALLTVVYYWDRPTARKDWFDKHPNHRP